MQSIQINNNGALNFVKKRFFPNSSDIICELLGCAPGKASNIYISIINDNLVITINDGGLKEKDMIRLKEFFNGGDNGHSEWGMGSRVAAAQLTNDANKSSFYILDNNSGIHFEFNPNSNGKYKELTNEEVNDYNIRYASELDNDKYYTKWIVPVSPEFQESKNLEKIKNDLKLRYSMPIIQNKITVKFKDEKIILTNQPYEITEWDNIEIVFGKKKINKKAKGNAKNMYKINNKYYSKNGDYLSKEDDIEFIKSKYIFKASYYNPTTEQLKSISKEYGIKETEINGLIISNKNVLKSTNFILAKGQRNAGTDSSKHSIICFTDEKNELCKSSVEKNIKPNLEHAIKEFLDLYKNFKTPSIKQNNIKNQKNHNNENHKQQNNRHNDNHKQQNNSHNDKSDYLIKKKRNSDDNFNNSDRSELYEENRKIYIDKFNSCPRCPCCDRKIWIKNFHAGHIKSVNNGGKKNITNGLAICNKCNGNDTRNIVDMVKEEWGDEHTNYKKLNTILKFLNKSIN